MFDENASLLLLKLRKVCRYVIIYTRSITELQTYFYDEIDEGVWLRYKLGTWLRQVVDELAHT